MTLAPQETQLLSEHLKAFSAVNVDAAVASNCLEMAFRTYGPVTRTSFGTLRDGINYILPVKSLITRLLVLEIHDWSLLISDMRGESCHVDAYAVSRSTGCKALGLVLQDQRRELHVYEEGANVREVQSLCDGDRWYYREQGQLQVFEDPCEYRGKKQRQRLRVEALRNYFKLYTGFEVPDWPHVNFARAIGLQRSTHEVRNPIKEFKTSFDVQI
jgi:hypothetical protein